MEPPTDRLAAHPILVTGGTGTLGRLVVAGLRRAGRDVRVLSRGKRSRDGLDGIEFAAADLATGDGIDAALEGIEVVVHCAGSAKGDEDKARHLVAAASRAGVRHLVYIAVVGDETIPAASGIDRLMFGYFGSKLAAERVIAGSGVPWTTLHATQFHQGMLLAVRAMTRMPVVPVPSGFRFQPVDAGEVADRLVELALGAPAGRVPDMAGPRVYELTELVRSYLRARAKHGLIVHVPVFGRAAGAVRAGAILATDRAVGRRTWEEFLAAEVGSPSDGAVEAGAVEDATMQHGS